jgi:hypothetical protein
LHAARAIKEIAYVAGQLARNASVSLRIEHAEDKLVAYIAPAANEVPPVTHSRTKTKSSAVQRLPGRFDEVNELETVACSGTNYRSGNIWQALVHSRGETKAPVSWAVRSAWQEERGERGDACTMDI